MVESIGAIIGALLACNFVETSGLGRIKGTATLGGYIILG